MKNLISQLKARRIQIGLSTAMLAEMSGTTQSNISNFENGKANITIKLLFKICDALNVSLLLQ